MPSTRCALFLRLGMRFFFEFLQDLLSPLLHLLLLAIGLVDDGKGHEQCLSFVFHEKAHKVLGRTRGVEVAAVTKANERYGCRGEVNIFATIK